MSGAKVTFNSTLRAVVKRASLCTALAFALIIVTTILKLTLFNAGDIHNAVDQQKLWQVWEALATVNGIIKSVSEVTGATFLVYVLFDSELKGAEERNAIVPILERIQLSEGGKGLARALSRDLEHIEMTTSWARFDISIVADKGRGNSTSYLVYVKLEERIAFLTGRQSAKPQKDSMQQYSGDRDPWELTTLNLKYNDGNVFNCLQESKAGNIVNYMIRPLPDKEEFSRTSTRMKTFRSGIMENHVFRQPTGRVFMNISYEAKEEALEQFPINIFVSPNFVAFNPSGATLFKNRTQDGNKICYELEISEPFLPGQGFSFYRDYLA